MKATSDEVVGLIEAAKLAGVTTTTIRNWASAGHITARHDKDILTAMNKGKNGAPHTTFYLRTEVVEVAESMPTIWRNQVEPTFDLIDREEAAAALAVSPRTMDRIRDRQNLQTVQGTDQKTYFRREDIERQVVGETYKLATGTPEEQKAVADAARAAYEERKAAQQATNKPQQQ
jgi:predicted site-specific integrase-resolvase